MSKLLVIGPAWVGDTVISQSLFKLLKIENPNLVIDVLAPPWTLPLLARMPEVSETIPLPFLHGEFNFKARWQLGKSLRHKKYDQAIVLPNSWKSALIPFAAHIPKRTGWRGEWRFGLLNNVYRKDKRQLPLMAQRFLILGKSEKIDLETILEMYKPKLEITKDSVSSALRKFNLNTDKKIIVFCPGAEYGPAKRWPPRYFAEIAKIKHQEDFQIWLLGSKKDAEITGEIQSFSGNICIDLAGSTQLDEAIDLLSLASIVITNDSGLMHVAAALDRPIVALYGSSSPAFTPPLTKQARILSLHLACSPCFQRVCPLKHFKCLEDLKPEQVLEVLP